MYRRIGKKILSISVFLMFTALFSQNALKIYSNIGVEDTGRVYLLSDEGKVFANASKGRYTVKNVIPDIKGTDEGISFQWEDTAFSGILYYGFIDYEDGRYALPVFFKKKSVIVNGEAEISIAENFVEKYDIVGWHKNKKGVLGYRIQNSSGFILYEGRVNFTGDGPFRVANTITEGPFVNLVTDSSAVISLETLYKSIVKIDVDGKVYQDRAPVKNHEILINSLQPEKTYVYSVLYGKDEKRFSFRTSPLPGTRRPFVFGYASDSRAGIGGGERNVYGVNYYIVKKIMALAAYKNAAFMQFTGDLISGYCRDIDESSLEYANWKRAVEPFAHYLPIYLGMGNHEILMYNFPIREKHYGISIDRFPFKTESSEAQFARNFVLPKNGPLSEDGAVYDPDKEEINFPSYKENVYYYTYDNIAMIVLNSNYWFAPSIYKYTFTGGNLHGYIMDKQLEWFSNTLEKFEKDKNIDHIFVTFHTPLFPNGGHVSDCMWYKGDNSKRAYVKGNPVPYGIIERRDQLMDLMINKSRKVAAVFTGDEHNYCRLKISNDMARYPKDYDKTKISLKRELWQINNGAAGAPYYAEQRTPWSGNLKRFSTQNALVLIYVDGKTVRLEVLNPDTMELVDKALLIGE